MISITKDSAQINIEFYNNTRVSIQYGPGMYGDHRDLLYQTGEILSDDYDDYIKWMNELKEKGARECEVAVFYGDEFVITPYSEDIVIPYVDTRTLVNILHWVMNAEEEVLKNLVHKIKSSN